MAILDQVSYEAFAMPPNRSRAAVGFDSSPMAGSCRLIRDPPVNRTPSVYGSGPVGERIMSLYHLGPQLPGNCSDPTSWASRLSYAECRSLPHWCDLPKGQARDAPPSFGGKLPCGLADKCAQGLRSVRFFHGLNNRSLSQCLRNRRIVLVGDSTLQELMVELAMTLSRDVPSFTSAFLSLG
jgi:hypothetical protein